MNKDKIDSMLSEMKLSIINCLAGLEQGYGQRKWAISKQTNIPIDILTVLLKQLKIEGKVKIMVLWCEHRATPKGSGYCLTKNN